MAKSVTKIPATIGLHNETLLNIPAKRKVAGYARVSTDHDEQLTSYEAQLDYYTTMIGARSDWTFAGMYSDEGITGTSVKKREGFQNMVADALAGKIDLIVTKSVSRFARNTVDSLTTIRKLKDHNIEVYFEKENIWTFDTKGELLITIMSSIAQEESRSISENVTWGHRRRMEAGKVCVPFSRFIGYDKGEDGNLVINEEEAETVKFIFAEFLGGLSPCAIASKLTDKRIKTPGGGKKWNQKTVKGILSNEKYKGDALLQKTYTVDYLSKKKARNTGQVPQYYVRNNHKAIIEPSVFDHVQELLKERTAMNGISSGTIFSSKIICGCCGKPYGPKVWHSNDQYRRVIWQCNSKFKDKTYCKTPHLTEDQIKTEFVKAVNKLIPDRTEVLEELHRVQTDLSGTEELETRQKQLIEQMNMDAEAVQDLITENARKVQDQNAYQARYDTLAARYEESKTEYDRVTVEIAQRGIRKQSFEQFIQSVEDLPEFVSDFSDAMWSSLVDHITVHSKDDIVFTLTNGMEIKA